MVLAVAACGIPSIPTIEAPLANPGTGSTLGFGSPPTGYATAFRGYELYYRFYQVTDFEPPRNLRTRFELLNQGFVRLSTSDDRPSDPSRPLIEVPLGVRAAPHSVLLSVPTTLQTDAEPTLAVSWNSSSVEVRRGVPDPLDSTGNSFARFSAVSEYQLEQVDVAKIVPELESAFLDIDVRLLVYVLSFGVFNFEEAHSVAVYLGEIQVTLPVD